MLNQADSRGIRAGLTMRQGNRARVLDTQKQLGTLWLHVVSGRTGQFIFGSKIKLTVEEGRRQALRQHHSATHLLHEALRQRTGRSCGAKGIFVAPDRLRFDFSHTAALSAEALARVSTAVNQQIQANTARSQPASCPQRMQRRRGPWPCLVKNTAMKCAWFPWARKIRMAGCIP